MAVDFGRASRLFYVVLFVITGASLPLASLDRLKLQRALDEIGRTPLPEASPAQT